MKILVYHLFRIWVKLGFSIFFKEIRIKGRNNLPDRNTAVIFLPNHQNTFLDAICVAMSSSRRNHYMARGDIFTNPTVKKLTAWINLRPIYRIRDGREALGKNEAVFNELVEFLSKNQGVMLHPEGTHSLQYRTRALKKGFARISLRFMDNYPKHKLVLVPVGLNYDRFTRFRSNLTIAIGEAIDARQYLGDDKNKAIDKMVSDVAEGIKSLTLQIPAENYDEHYQRLREANADLSNYEKVQKLLTQNKIEDQGRDPWQPSFLEKILYPLALLLHFPAIFLWKKIKPTFKDCAWHGPIKLVIGTFITPLYLLIFTMLIGILGNWLGALAYLAVSILITPVLKFGQD